MNSKGFSLFPFVLFIILFILSGLIYNDFYAISSVFWMLLVLFVTFISFKGTFNDKLQALFTGFADKNILTMCVIFLLSGAFTSLAKSLGAIEYISYLLLEYVPSSYFLIVVFILACVLSFSLGTSVGTIIALAPIIFELGQTDAETLVLLAGGLLGGAMFGDNLSFISDTTIAATQTMEVRMIDKFKANGLLAGLAGIITIFLLSFYKFNGNIVNLESVNTSWWVLLPYMILLVLAFCGWHVVKVLSIAVLSSFVLLFIDTPDLVKYASTIMDGIQNVFEIVVLSLLIGGLVQLIKEQGGIDWLIEKLHQIIQKSKAKVPFVLALLTSLINVAVANNTIALMIVGPIANKISTKYDMDKPRMTSLIDIVSCVTQGLLPYGAQVLILVTLLENQVDYLQLVTHSFYIWSLFLVTFLSFVFYHRKKANLKM